MLRGDAEMKSPRTLAIAAVNNRIDSNTRGPYFTPLEIRFQI
jgi:hypothetical protein